MSDPAKARQIHVRKGLGLVGFTGILLITNALLFDGSHALGLAGLAATLVAAVGAWRLAHMRDSTLTVERQATDQLKANETLLLSTLDVADVRVFQLDAGDRITEVFFPPSHPLIQPREWFLGKRPSELDLGPSLLEAYETFLPRLHAGEARAESDYTIAFPHEVRHFHAMAQALRSESGQYRGCIVVSRDQTAQVAQAREIRESEAKFRSLYEASSDAILIMEGDRYLDCNLSALMMFRYTSVDEFRALGIGDLSADFEVEGRPSNEVAREHRETAFAMGSHSFEWRQRRKDGSTFASEVLMTRVSLADRQVLEIVVRDITRRKAAEQALLSSRERFRVLFETNPLGLVLSDMEGRFLESNGAYAAILGYAIEELRHLTYWDLTPREYEPQEQEMLRQMKERRAYGPYEKEYRRKDGSRVPVRLNGVVVRSSAGEDQIWSVIEDITDQKAWEAALQGREARLQSLIGNAPVGIFETDASGAVTFINPELARLTGLPPDSLLGWGWGDALHPEDREAVQKAWGEFIAGRAPFQIEFRFQRAEGEVTWAEGRASAIHGPSGEISGFMGTVLDVSSRKEALKEMDHLASILRTTKDFIATFDTEGFILYLNPSGRKLLGYAPDADLHNFSLSGLIPPSATDKVMNEAIPTAFMHQSWTGDTAIITAEGEEIPVNQIITAHKNAKGFVEYYSTSLRDISDRVRIEEELRKHRDHLQELVDEQTVHLTAAIEDAHRANQAKSTFLANMSHELRTPVHAIISFSDLGLGRTQGGDPAQEKLHRYYGNINTSAKRLLILLNDLLDLSKLEAGRMTYQMGVHDFRQVLEEARVECHPLMEGKRLDFQVEVEATHMQVTMDPMRIGQVVRNLLGNAIKFSPEGGRLRVRLSEASLPGDPEKAGEPARPALSFALADEGPGIPLDELEAVFDPFVQSSKTKSAAGGTGLGLPICREILTGHQGRIWAANRPEGGSVFSFLLPLRAPMELR